MSLKNFYKILAFLTAALFVGALYFLWREQKLNTAFEQCLSEALPQMQACLAKTLPQLFEDYGAVKVMKAFENYVAKEGATFYLHEAAHRIGEALYLFLQEDINKALALCTTAAHSGCQHAVMGIMASQRGVPLRDIKELPQLCQENSKGPGGYYLCIHGLGHSFLVGREGEVPLALSDCDRFGLYAPLAQSCYTGVFMENVTNIMGGGGKYVKADDPLFPCTLPELPEKYLATCYWELNLPSKMSLREAFDTCFEAPQKWQLSCARGIGIYVASAKPGFLNSIIQDCGSNYTELKTSCLKGALAYLSLSDNLEGTHDFCKKLPEGDKVLVCGSKTN